MGYLRCAREVAPHMRAQRWGRIVNISGLAARQSGNAVGSMRNVSVAAMTKNLADELGPDGINVTVVHPGLTRTERTAALVAHQARTQSLSEREVEQRMADGNSIRHLVDAAEVAMWWLSWPRRNRSRSTATRSPRAAGRCAASTIEASRPMRRPMRSEQPSAGHKARRVESDPGLSTWFRTSVGSDRRATGLDNAQPACRRIPLCARAPRSPVFGD